MSKTASKATGYAPDYWLETGGENVNVAILDTGCEPVPYIRMKPLSFVRDATTRDFANHGTRVARTIGSFDPIENGIAPLSTIYSAKILGPLTPPIEAIERALEWCCDVDIDVVVMAFVSTKRSERATGYLKALDKRGTIVCASYHPQFLWPHGERSVASAGNEPDTADVATNDVIMLRNSDGRTEAFRGNSAATATLGGIAACAKGFDPAINRRKFLNELKRQTIEMP